MFLGMHTTTVERKTTTLDSCKKNGEFITWDQIKQLANQTTHSWMIYRLPQEAVELTNCSKMRVCLMEKVCSLPHWVTYHFVSKN